MIPTLSSLLTSFVGTTWGAFMPGARWTFHAATSERWADLEQLFGAHGACGGCWCMVWRFPRSEYEAGKGPGNRKALRTLTRGSVAPGILAYDGDQAIGWCAVAPREAYPYLERSRVLKPLDDKAVWSVSCLFVARAYRRQGLSVALLRGAVRFAAGHGARIVEGYPVIPYSDKMPGPFAWTGTHSAFVSAGFVEAGRHSAKRRIMRWSVPRLGRHTERRSLQARDR